MELGASPGATFNSEFLEWGSEAQRIIPVKRTISTGQTSTSWRNTSGGDVVCFNATLSMASASSTYTFNLYATSTASLAAVHDYTALTDAIIGPNARLIRNHVIATSTTATTTTQFKGLSSDGSIVVPGNSYLVGAIQQTGAALCTGATCETATSTNRGGNPTFMALYYK